MTNSDDQAIKDYLANLTAERRPTIEALDKLIRRWQPALPVKLWHSMGFDIIGYGSVTYARRSRQAAQWFIIGLAAHKTYFSLYLWGVVDGRYLTEVLGQRLGQVKVGKSCLNFKSLEDLNLSAVEAAVGQAVEINLGRRQS